MPLIDKILNLPLPVLNHWGYWIVLFGAMLEAIPLVGLFAPGMLIVIIGGFFAKIGILEVGDVIFFASIGAIIGDLIGYSIGKKYGYSFLSKYGKYFFFKKEHFEKTKKLMNHHTGKALIIGRFNSLTRAFAPFVAGTSNIPFIKFIIYNIIGGISWAISFVMIGYIFGKGYEIAAQYIGKFIFIAIVLSAIIIYLYRFINKRKHIFSRYHLYALILNIFSLYLFSKMVEDIIDGELITKLDVWLNAKVVMFWNPFFNKIMIFITNIASPSHLFALSLILFGILIYKKKWYYSLLLLFSMVGGLLFELLTKLIIQRARPENALIEVSGYSFPSGHATMAIIFFSLLLYSFKDDIKNSLLKKGFIIMNIFLFLIIGFSRVYLNVHWFSDIISGFALGLFWLTLLILIFKTIISLSKKTLNMARNFLGGSIKSKKV
ncbi:MAG TPA: phosphatase PAP2 family protein [Candidatus Pacearchaeota archaeon]|nr:inner membrane protein YabI [archaeon BMS3Abin17]HDK42187.1 phosphatase PAP2 family protein [Candidatus Pacearchaeota archaeon]HDZ60230.1 phosphatase PAP2 family protein [Candidatus Pacearchaeota archaeon]